MRRDRLVEDGHVLVRVGVVVAAVEGRLLVLRERGVCRVRRARARLGGEGEGSG